MKIACKYCKTIFKASPSKKRIFCSRKCSTKGRGNGSGRGWKRNNPFGKKALHWKGGRVLINGCPYVYKPKHPHTFNGRYVKESRLLMEKEIGHLLQKSEVVHHKDGNPLNNNVSNLVVCKTRGTHTAKYHSKKH